YQRTFQVQGRPLAEGAAPPTTLFQSASVDYFKAIGVPLLEGRGFLDADRDSAPPVALVNRTLAHHAWPGESPVGKRISFNQGRVWIEIVGVIGDVKQNGLGADVPDLVYVPFEQAPGAGTLLARTTADPLNLAKRITASVYAIDPNQPVANARTLEQLRRNSMASPRLTTTLLTLFAALALVITATGLAGVIAFSVTQRTHEIGIRMALGAERGEVLQMVMRQGLAMVVVGLAVGVAGAIALSHLMAGLLFGVNATDPITFVAVALLIFGVALAACFIPARRATAISPMLALRGN
ncbi:MAG TPA: FtsX-like permease family protein, partial [Gemmatimonadaceae bacterium]|nr:FtsX-like permease family protein [Gemmatimonadaceae bacterium]